MIRRTRFDKAVEIFRQSGGILRTDQAVRAGIHPSTLYAMRDSGVLEQARISEVASLVTSFLKPAARALVEGRVLKATWIPPGPWK